MTNRQLRNHITKIRFRKFLVLFFAVVAVLCIYGSVLLTNYCYDLWLNPTEGTTLEQGKSIARAISLRPAQAEGYNKILDLYLEDGILTEAENDHFCQLLNDQQNRLNRMPNEAAALYRRLAYSYISCYDADPESRFKKAYSFYELTKPYYNATELEITTIDTYLAIGAYFSEYVWIEGSLREPSSIAVSDMLRRMGAMMDALQEGSERDRMAYACCMAMLISKHRDMWVEKAGADSVAALENHIRHQSVQEVKDPVAIRLQKELASWNNEKQNEEVVP